MSKYPAYKNKDQRITDMFHEKQENIRKNMDKKTKDIAYFNSLNAAINLVSGGKYTKDEILEWRDFFFDEWVKWQAEEEKREDQEDEDETIRKFDEAVGGKTNKMEF